MRHFLFAVLLTAVLGIGSVNAADLTAAEVGQLISLSDAALKANQTSVTISVGGTSLELTISRDSLGTLIARPKIPGQDLGISQICIQTQLQPGGLRIPKSMLVIGSDLAIRSFSLQTTVSGSNDVSVSSMSQVGVFSGGSAGGGGSNPAGGINSQNNNNNGGTPGSRLDQWVSNQFPGYTSASQLNLPAGAGTSEVSKSKP